MSKRFYITGATGIVGQQLIRSLLLKKNSYIVAQVRDLNSAKRLFGDATSNIEFFKQDIDEPIKYTGDVDYIVHAAAPTSSSYFVEHPVGTIKTIVDGTMHIMDFAITKHVKSIVFLSSMEIYGTSTKEDPITENDQFYCELLSARSSYPQAKRLAETLCFAYFSEHNVPVKIVRLAQVIDKKINPRDNRVVSMFAKAAINSENISLATDGKAKQTYIGIDDATSAIIRILFDGKNGQAYNVANPDTYCSIREFAEMVASDIAQNKIKVTTKNINSGIYPPNRTINLCVDKLTKLGWRPSKNLIDIFQEIYATKKTKQQK